MRLLFVLVSFTAACQRKPTVPTCDVMADHVLALFSQGSSAPDQFSREVRDVFSARCREDKWSDEMRACVGGTSAVVAPQNCRKKLVAGQAQRLDHDLKVVEERDARGRIPPVCDRYERVLAQALACDKLPKEIREQLAAKFARAKSEWAAMPDKRELGVVCSGAIQALKSAALDCPDASKW